MKLLPLLLGLSLAANAALLVVNRRGGAVAREARVAEARVAEGREAGLVGLESKRAVPATGEGKAIAAALNEGDAEALRDELLAAGVDEDLIRSIVSARIWKRYENRMKALQANQTTKPAWWKNDEDGYWGALNKEQRAAMKALQAEMKAENERVLGKDPEAGRSNPWLERQYGFVPPEKREALQQLEQDYNELSGEMRREAKGFQMPADAEKARFLQEEKLRDLAAILTPEELADYERRQSRTAQNLRWQMTQMDASEAEYLAIFEIRKDFDEQYADYDNFGNRLRSNLSPEQRQQRGEAEAAMKAQLKETLGADRYKAYIRSQDNDYQQLANATKRFDLPADTPAKIYDLRDEVPREALRIADDSNLTPEQKREELKKLADATRDRVSGALGPDVARVYFENNNGMQWLRQLEQGTIISFDENGVQTHRRLDQPTKNTTPAKVK